jgi:diacylglycerol kinase
MTRLIRSFGFACAGLVELFRLEPNARIHAAAVTVTTGLGLLMKIQPLEWALIVLCFGGVIAAELVNTAIERLGDAVSADVHPLIKSAKDCAAAAVLVSAASSVVVAGFIFLPRLAPGVLSTVLP